MSGLTSMAETFMAEQAAQRPLTTEEASRLRERHQDIRARAERLLGVYATARTEQSSVHPAANAPARHYEHHWRAPAQVGDESAYSVHDEPATMYAQIGACTLRNDSEVVAYEIRAFGVPQGADPGSGPRWPFVPQFPKPAVLEGVLPNSLLQADADRLNYFDTCLADLERITLA